MSSLLQITKEIKYSQNDFLVITLPNPGVSSGGNSDQ
jgi:hypothetical protein